MKNTFMDSEFLLDTETARTLYHNYAERMPIFDYHNHLSAKDIAEHRRFFNLEELWLEGDHYKWRAMRANGVEEHFITGNAEPYEKYEKWTWVLPRLAGSPLYHWTHLELQRYFGIHDILRPQNARSIWDRTEEMMRGEGFDTVSLLEKMNVKVLCTTDDPGDSLEWHKKIAEDPSIPFRVCPSFRPDRYLSYPSGKAAKTLCEKYCVKDIAEALIRSLDFFVENGCLVSDHGFGVFPYIAGDEKERRFGFGAASFLKKEEQPEPGEPDFSELMRILGSAYAKRGIVMQLHLGAIRNNSPRLMKLFGPDAGGDSVGPSADPSAIAAFLGDLEKEHVLPRTILYNLHPSDNTMLSTMAGCFAPQVQFGAAWWLNDHIRGISAQIDELMETGAFSAAVGMLTDSRSFTSFVRHEYFRRIMCAKLGRLVEEGLYPPDEKFLGEMVMDVCYRNAERFFGTL